MPITFRIFNTQGLIVLKPTAVITERCVLDYFDRLRADPLYRVEFDRLVVNTKLDDVDITYPQMRNIQANEMLSRKPPERRVTTVFFVENGAGLGMARMYQSLAEASARQEVRLTETLSDALLHLGLDPAKEEELTQYCRA